MKKTYKFGEYYSPLDMFKIAKKKLKRTKWSVLLLPISSILFLFNIITSIMLYPLFILNKYFHKFQVNYVKTTSVFNHILKLIADFLYDIIYTLYWFFMPINRLFAIVYMAFPSRVVYYSNQTILLSYREVAELKENLRAEVYDALQDVAEREIAACFEKEFFLLVNNIISDAQK